MQRTHLISACLILLMGCSPLPPRPEVSLLAPPLTTAISLPQLMDWVIDPAADVIWDSVKSIMTASGTQEIAPKTDEQWEAVRNGAATLVEAGNLLMMEGRAKDGKEWMAATRRLSATAEKALKAAQAKRADALFDAGGDIYNACKGCHDRYASFDQAAPAAK
jgi:hypothetical protein